MTRVSNLNSRQRGTGPLAGTAPAVSLKFVAGVFGLRQPCSAPVIPVSSQELVDRRLVAGSETGRWARACELPPRFATLAQRLELAVSLPRDGLRVVGMFAAGKRQRRPGAR